MMTAGGAAAPRMDDADSGAKRPRGPTEDRSAEAERNLAWIRAAVVLVNSVIYLTMLDPAVGSRELAYAVILFANAYSFVVVLFEPGRRLDPVAVGAVTTAIDALFITAWLVATGGFDSPFYVLWYVSLAAVSYRFDYRATVAAGVAYSALYIGMVASLGQYSGHVADIAIRVAYILFVATLGALLARESLSQFAARQRLEERTQTMEMEAIERTTRLRAVEEAEAKFRAISETANDAIISADDSGRIIHFNQGAERTFGYKAEEVAGRPLTIIMPPRFHEAHQAGLARYLSTGEAHVVGRTVELVGLRRDGTELPVELSIAAWKAGENTFFTAIIRDLTERKRAEAERLSNMEKLKELERLKEEDRFKTQFINIAAHELNTPLTPIKLQVHLLKAGKAGKLDPEQEKAVSILDRNVDRLAQLVGDVLEVARMQAGRLGVEKEPIDLNRIVLEAVESFQAGARQSGIDLKAHLSPDISVRGDARRVNQVLFNLLTNALKFTPASGRISVETVRSEGAAVVTVRDTGVGLRPEEMEKLFKPFSQVHDAMQRTKSGTGLGLYISKGLIELHGGRLWCDSAGPGLGSAFHFTLPFGEAPTPRPREIEPVAEAKQGDLARRARELI